MKSALDVWLDRQFLDEAISREEKLVAMGEFLRRAEAEGPREGEALDGEGKVMEPPGAPR